ncbi:hypothetical protein [Butyrivibrio sp. MC2021]|uniref:hypothetical protein n=1 Tax=Butyrivibrio sp. MC2021 TaxID=1408306 RepID=UPI000479A970|nr:hypothetical protein [Butyrivibrio sp. MC2021]
MFYYLVYGLNVQSNIEFPQLLSGEEGGENRIDLFIEVKSGDELKKKLADPEKPEVEIGNTADGMWFSNQAGTFLLEHRDGVSYMTCEKYEGVPDSIARSFLLGNCIAIIMTMRGKIVLHGSTVVLGDKTALVCGDSGTGKSTTAMALLDAGGKLLSDDISVLDVDPADGKVYSLPGFPEQKLCRDAAVDNGFNVEELTYIDEERDKFSVDRRDIFLTDKKKVDMLISLHTTAAEKAEGDTAFEKGVRFMKIDGGEKVNAITDRFFLNWLYGHGFVLRPEEMVKCFALAGQIEVMDITRVRGLDTKEYLVERLIKEIKG